MSMFKRKKKKDFLDPILDDIKLEENQIELIDLIRKGKIEFIDKGSKLKILPTTQYYKELWVSKCKRIKLWHEDPGWMSFTYLKINGEELIDKIKYGSEIALTIQNPKKNYIVSNVIMKNRRRSSIHHTYEEFINGK